MSAEQRNLAICQLEGTIKKYEKGEIVIKENHTVDRIGVILKGNLCISKYTEEIGRAHV